MPRMSRAVVLAVRVVLVCAIGVAGACSSPQVTPIRLGDAATGEEDTAPPHDGITLTFSDGPFGADAPAMIDVPACVGDACGSGDGGLGITCGNKVVEDTETCDDGNS